MSVRTCAALAGLHFARVPLRCRGLLGWPSLFQTLRERISKRALSGDDAPSTSTEGDDAPGVTVVHLDSLTIRINRESLPPGLYVVGTPIGNLADISLRALCILKSCDVILAEDTRHSRKLLNRYGIRAEVVSFHEHNKHAREAPVIQRLQAGQAAALISDAGMPGISDPGSSLVAACVLHGIDVVPIPGPCAAVAALVASGLPTDDFRFVGFLPAKSPARRKALGALRQDPATLVVYVSPHSALAVLADVAAELGADRRVSLGRELTKVHETHVRGTVADVLQRLQDGGDVKGELTLVVEGAPRDEAGGAGMTQEEREAALAAQIRAALESGQSPSAAAKSAARELPWAKRNHAYETAVRLSQEQPS